MSSKDEEADKPDEAGETPSHPKRPAQTIDLKAEEVEIEIRPAGSAKDGGSDESDEDPDDGGDAKKAAPDAATGPKIGAKPPPPPQRTKPSDVRGFVTHLAAGLVGGLVGVVGAGIGLDRLPIPGMGNVTAPGQDLAAIEQRIDELAARLDAVPASAPDAASVEKLDGLEKRLAAMESKPAPAEPAIPEELNERVAGLEQTLKALQASGSEAGAGALEQSAALVARVDAIEKTTREKVEALAGDLSQARAALEKAASSPAPSGDSGAIDDMARRIAGLEKAVAAAAAASGAGETVTSGGTGAVALAYESLRRAAQAGEPFKTQLEVLAKVTGQRGELEPLTIPAARGVPTRAALMKEWPSVREQARMAAEKADDETFLDRLASNASAVVRIRRIERADAAPGETPGASLEAAVVQAEAFEGTASASAATWLEQARTRVALDKALAALEAALLSGVSGTPPEKG